MDLKGALGEGRHRILRRHTPLECRGHQRGLLRLEHAGMEVGWHYDLTAFEATQGPRAPLLRPLEGEYRLEKGV